MTDYSDTPRANQQYVAPPRSDYRLVVADPPWDVRLATGTRKAGTSSGSVKVYPGRPAPYETMSIEDIAAIPVGEWCAPDAGLLMWCVDQYLIDGSVKAVAEAWGFEVGRQIVWEKANAAQGRFPVVAHESIVVCRRGSFEWNPDARFTSVQHWKQVYENGAKKHSAKPDGALDMAEAVCPDGPWLELFARDDVRFGWDTWGDQSIHGGRAA